MRLRDAQAGKSAIESALNLFLDRLGVGAPMRVVVNKLFGRRRLIIMVRGKKVSTGELERVLYDQDDSIGRTAFESSGLKPTFSYLGGYNIIVLTRPYPPLSSLTRIIIAAVLGFIVCGISSLFLPQESISWALNTLVTPLFDLYLEILRGIAGPLIFLSVACAASVTSRRSGAAAPRSRSASSVRTCWRSLWPWPSASPSSIFPQ